MTTGKLHPVIDSERSLINKHLVTSQLKTILQTGSLMRYSQMMTFARKQTIATARPSLPISSASAESLICEELLIYSRSIFELCSQQSTCSGVSGRSVSNSTIIFPHSEFFPTAVTRKRASPSTTEHPERMNIFS
jgi:hypothetical protein